MSVLNDIINDVQEVKRVADQLSGHDWVRTAKGLGIIATVGTAGKILPGVAGKLSGLAAKSAIKLGSYAGKLGAEALNIASTAPLKLVAIPAAFTVASATDRYVNKTPSKLAVQSGWITGRLSDNDKARLQRTSFRLSDIWSAHHQTRIISKVLRPSWFKDGKREIKK